MGECEWRHSRQSGQSAITLHSARHCVSRSGSPSTADTIRAPCRGGLEYMGRTTVFICERTRSACEGNVIMTVTVTVAVPVPVTAMLGRARACGRAKDGCRRERVCEHER